MRLSRIQAVDDVMLEAAPGLEDDLRWFYGEVAELDEMPPDGCLDPGICFKSERIAVRIRFLAEPRIDPVACRVTLAVLSLDDAIEKLSERRAPFERRSGFAWADRRIQVLDPAGNRVEFRSVSRDLSL